MGLIYDFLTEMLLYFRVIELFNYVCRETKKAV